MKFLGSKISDRYGLVAGAFVLIAFIILVAAIKLVMNRSYWEKVAERFVLENVSIQPSRGNILADNGEVLAASIPEYRMYMDFMSWERKDSLRRDKEQHWRDSVLYSVADSISQGMHEIFPDINPVAFKKHLLKGRKVKSHHWLLYKKRVSYIQYCRVKSLPLFRFSSNKGGFHVETFKTRKNPYGELAKRTIGDLYKQKDSARTGIELSYDTVLRGKPGLGHRQKVNRSYMTIIDREAVDGCDVQTTLNVEMQDICEKALSDKLVELEAKSGVCILMEVATGDIKAITSLQRGADGRYREVNADAVKNLYEPGSVFKPMSFLVAMDDGYIHMNDKVDVGCGIREMYGAMMRDANWRSGGSGVMTVPQILQKSSNVGVSSLIDKYYHENPQNFVEGIYRIGVAEDLKIPIPGYAKPRIRMPKPDGSNWSKTALPWMSIGYETQVPPITTVTFYNGIANNGRLMRPRLVKAVLRDGQIVREIPVHVLRDQMAKPQAVKNIQDCLASVVSVGLGKKARSKYFTAAGKTGTAQLWTRKGFMAEYLISFAGYFPAEKPLYSCIVCICKSAPASGGGMCAPVFKRVSEAVMAQYRSEDYSVARDTLHCLLPEVKAGNMCAATKVLSSLGLNYNSSSVFEDVANMWGVSEVDSKQIRLNVAADARERVMPNVLGYGLRDALYRLEKLGLKVRTTGVGTVSAQSIKPGEEIQRGQSVILTLGKKKNTANNSESSPKVDAVKTDKLKREPEDSELTPTLADEKKMKKAEQKSRTSKKQ